MSVTLSKAEGVTVITVTSNPKSSCPPLCQVLGALCYSPVCCSLAQGERRTQPTVLSALGVVQIMIGLLNIGLGAIINDMDEPSFPFWFGALCILFGILCILADKFPSPCLVFVNVLMNLLGVIFALVVIVLYILSLVNLRMWWLCSQDDYDEFWNPDNDTLSPTPSDEDVTGKYREECMKGKEMILMLVRGMAIVLNILAVLQLCVNISCAVLGIKALRNRKGENMSIQEPEVYKPLLDAVTTNPIA